MRTGANSPIDEGRERAEQERATRGYAGLKSCDVVDGIIQPVRPYRSGRNYFPMGAPHIVSEFARVTPGDAAAALRFVRRWGLLGYGQLTGQGEGDPLKWFHAHVFGVRVALEISKRISKGDDDELEDYISDLGGSPHGYGVRQHIRPASELASLVRPLGDSEPIINGAATVYLNAIINPNLVGVYLQLSDGAPTPTLAQVGRYHLVFQWDALISVIYRHAADVVVGGRIRVCDSCGLPFRQTHARQRFCPAPPPERSLCEMRYTKARQRREGKRP